MKSGLSEMEKESYMWHSFGCAFFYENFFVLGLVFLRNIWYNKTERMLKNHAWKGWQGYVVHGKSYRNNWYFWQLFA